MEAIRRKRFLWVASKAARWVALNLHVDRETKQWSIKSAPMFQPQFQTADYSDIAKIFKSKPETFKVHEERTSDGKFKSFSVETT